MLVWRIVSHRFADDAWSGEGARRYGSRWNTPGHGLVYTSGSVALAILEVLVNNPGVPISELEERFRLVGAQVDAKLVEELPPADLPPGWNATPAGRASASVGDRWFREQRSVALRVPSVVVPREANYLVNPVHPDFGRVVCGEPERLRIDPRLARKEGA